ncbi:MAG: hypothetical protein A2Y82_04140 [Candidatus Buchananbacteria bacterium RBG_13_36_9]|uniref:DUF4230 domain-containing protein n=1 Tax=Candidatus Buchananbacteria bacterium RBG_13_36_9 TaxID=1797530 RepID=A0A1G1XSC7_9BACT|nr:MAG: hypothetical protein A2Y82_04140 [Candidatus Buchananbacteria bacterium RBG_13_36_9]
MKKHFFFISWLIVLIIGLGLGYLIFRPQPTSPKTDSLVIYNRLQSQGFLVTQSNVSEQKITIDNTSGDWLKDFLLGQTIEASGFMKTSLGVDLQKLQPEDIIVADKQIIINLPPVEIQSVEILWNIFLQNKQGILKRLFNNEDGYNEAFSQLKETARQAAMSEDNIKQAQESTIKEITRLVNLIEGEKEVVVKFK